MIRLRVACPSQGEFERIVSGESLVVGRSSRSDLPVNDPFLSRQHARLFKLGEEWYVEDLGSRNTTLLNGLPVTDSLRLSQGDVLRLSETEIRVLEIGARVLPTQPPPEQGEVYRRVQDLIAADSAEFAAMPAEKLARRLALRLLLVHEVHRALASSLSRDELLDMILERAFAHFRPEEAVVFLEERDGSYRPAAARRLPEAAGEGFYSRRLIQEVTQKGLAALVLDAQTDERFSTADSIVTSGVRSLLAAPLLDGERCLGMIALASRAHVRRFSEEDMELLASLASAAGLRLRNLALAEEVERRRYLDKELELARQIQLALLPSQLPEPSGFTLLGASTPSRTVSGDFYEVQERADGRELVLFVADVSGKGLAASLLAASLSSLLAGPVEVGLPPGEICEKLSRRLHARTPPERYATAFVAVLEPTTGRVLWANAGHNPGLLVRASSAQVERLSASGIPLGLWPGSAYGQAELVMEPGDTLVLYTDGWTEATNAAGEEYGIERLARALVKGREEPLAGMVATVTRDVEAFAGGRPFGDDRTLLLARRSA
jgi:sigma-B regulation protein RsbU (phosphoserine phosphatase)